MRGRLLERLTRCFSLTHVLIGEGILGQGRERRGHGRGTRACEPLPRAKLVRGPVGRSNASAPQETQRRPGSRQGQRRPFAPHSSQTVAQTRTASKPSPCLSLHRSVPWTTLPHVASVVKIERLNLKAHALLTTSSVLFRGPRPVLHRPALSHAANNWQRSPCPARLLPPGRNLLFEATGDAWWWRAMAATSDRDESYFYGGLVAEVELGRASSGEARHRRHRSLGRHRRHQTEGGHRWSGGFCSTNDAEFCQSAGAVSPTSAIEHRV